MKKGIDVSKHQGTIDWNAVKASGIEFAIIRCGYGGDYKKQDDVFFSRNVKECERVGIPYGIYLYSYANSVSDAESEAAHVLRLIKDCKPEYPIYYDLEDANTTGKCSKDTILQIAKTFVGILEQNNYWVGIYANKYWNTTYLTDEWYNSKARWIAQYNSKCTYDGEYGIWQYSSTGKVDGVNGNCDMNYAYIDYPKLIKEAGKNGFAKSESNSNSSAKKSNEEIAKEVINGLWGNGEDRKKRLSSAGYDYSTIQNLVNKMVGNNSTPKKSNQEIAKEVVRGLWGNGEERKNRLRKAGYDPAVIQKLVNKMI